MSDLARLLQQYGYGEQSNALAQDGVTYDTSNVLAAMPKPNPLADALRIAMRSLPENKEHAFSMSNMLRGGLDTAASWLDYQNKPQPSDYKPSEMLAPLGAGLMGTAFAPQNALGIFGGRLADAMVLRELDLDVFARHGSGVSFVLLHSVVRALRKPLAAAQKAFRHQHAFWALAVFILGERLVDRTEADHAVKAFCAE